MVNNKSEVKKIAEAYLKCLEAPLMNVDKRIFNVGDKWEC